MVVNFKVVVIIVLFSLLELCVRMKCWILRLSRKSNVIMSSTEPQSINSLQFQKSKLTSQIKFGNGLSSVNESNKSISNESKKKSIKKSSRSKSFSDSHQKVSKVKVGSQKLDQANRFVLGDGSEAITPANLLDLVRSTSPFIFSVSASTVDLEESVIYEDESDENDLIELLKEPLRSSTSTNTASQLNSGSTLSAALSPYPSNFTLLQVMGDHSVHPQGNSHSWLDVLQHPNHPQPFPASVSAASITTPAAQRIDYFVLCLSAHWATVASYVPTDVDSKIRGHCWADPSLAVLEAQWEAVKLALHWSSHVDSVSAKSLALPSFASDSGFGILSNGILSGHSGELLSVLSAALCAFIRTGDTVRAREAQELVAMEVGREAQVIRQLIEAVRAGKGGESAETAFLKACSIVTHNMGDIDQGLSYTMETTDARAAAEIERVRALYGRLAHDGHQRYDGVFVVAKRIYKELLSAEGHRNYPLREARVLRQHRELLLPLGPWLESWGRCVAEHPLLSDQDRALVVRQLLRGCDSTSRAWCVPNQVGYYRALQGFNSVVPIDRLVRDKSLDKDCRELLRAHEVRSQLALSETQFAARLGRKARDLLLSM